MAKHVPERVSALGVCNFSPRQLTELLAYCKNNHLPRPVVVQNECHPYLPAREVRAICRKNGIVFRAYASLGAGLLPLLQDSTITSIAARLAVTPGQVLLRWGLQQGLLFCRSPASLSDRKRISRSGTSLFPLRTLLSWRS